MNNLQTFSNSEFGALEVLEIDGKPYFPATACAKVLGYKRPADAITAHCKGSVKYRVPTNGGEQELKFIPEGDLYRLIVHSKLPAAERFERWVFDEVLPAIRKQGMYAPDLTDTIAKIVSATVAETIKQIMPTMQPPSAKIESTEAKKKKKNLKPILCAIEKLPPDIRGEVDRMLISKQYSYRDVLAYLSTHGIHLSQMAVSKYYEKCIFGI